MNYDNDYVLCECALDPLRDFVLALEAQHRVEIVKEPAICLTMIRTRDSLEQQEFFLGEALATECEVLVDGKPGYGVCLGEEHIRAYSIAVCDSLLNSGTPAPPQLTLFLDRHRALLAERERKDFNLTLGTQVDFKLMEEED